MSTQVQHSFSKTYQQLNNAMSQTAMSGSLFFFDINSYYKPFMLQKNLESDKICYILDKIVTLIQNYYILIRIY